MKEGGPPGSEGGKERKMKRCHTSSAPTSAVRPTSTTDGPTASGSSAGPASTSATVKHASSVGKEGGPTIVDDEAPIQGVVGLTGYPFSHAPAAVATSSHAPAAVATSSHAPAAVAVSSHAPAAVPTSSHAPAAVTASSHAPAAVATTSHAPAAVATTSHAPAAAAAPPLLLPQQVGHRSLPPPLPQLPVKHRSTAAGRAGSGNAGSTGPQQKVALIPAPAPRRQQQAALILPMTHPQHPCP